MRSCIRIICSLLWCAACGVLSACELEVELASFVAWNDWEDRLPEVSLWTLGIPVKSSGEEFELHYQMTLWSVTGWDGRRTVAAHLTRLPVTVDSASDGLWLVSELLFGNGFFLRSHGGTDEVRIWAIVVDEEFICGYFSGPPPATQFPAMDSTFGAVRLGDEADPLVDGVVSCAHSETPE